MAGFPGPSIPAAEELVADDNPAGDPGADGAIDHVLKAAPSALFMLRQSSDVGIVVQEHAHTAELLHQICPCWEIVDFRQIGGLQDLTLFK